MKQLNKILLLLFFAVFSVQKSYSCWCADHLSIDSLSQLKGYDFIAYVKIVDDQNYKEKSKNSFGAISLHKIKILELFKGDGIDDILEYGKHTSCDMGISKGEEWILFGKIINGKIAVSACDRDEKYKNVDGLRHLTFGADSYKLRQLRKLYNHPIKKYDTEKRREFYNNGQIEIEENYINGKLNGECKKWYPNGRLLARTFYINDTIDGKSELFYKSGQLQDETYYLKGKKYNISRYYYDSTIDENLLRFEINAFYKTEDSLRFVYKRVQVEFESVYDSYGRALILRSFNRLGKMERETILDPVNKFETYIYYHDNGMIQSIQHSSSNKNFGHYQEYKPDGSLDKGWDYDKDGKAILNK